MVYLEPPQSDEVAADEWLFYSHYLAMECNLGSEHGTLIASKHIC